MALSIIAVGVSIGGSSSKPPSSRLRDAAVTTCPLGAALVSLVGVAPFLKANQARTARGAARRRRVVTIACSWVLVTVFVEVRALTTLTRGASTQVQGRAFRLPRLRPPRSPSMMFQVSDTDITQRAMRHQVFRHALVFLFGAVILATMVNAFAGLLNT
jgi:uncharacterized membrane protein